MTAKAETRIFEYDSDQNKGFQNFIVRAARDLITYRFAWINFISTNLSARYRRSTLGFFWTLLNPLFTMAIIAVVFSKIYNMPFKDFSLYLFSGQLPWILMSTSVTWGASSIISAEGYLKKVYVPKLIFPLTTIGVEVVNFLFSFLGLSVLMLLLGARPTLAWLFMPVALLLTACFCLGLIFVVCCIAVYFRDMIHILQILFLGLFYGTPIIYKPELLGPTMQTLLKLNPFFYYIELFHSLIYIGILPTFQTIAACIALALLSLTLGLYFFSLMEKNLIYRL